MLSAGLTVRSPYILAIRLSYPEEVDSLFGRHIPDVMAETIIEYWKFTLSAHQLLKI